MPRATPCPLRCCRRSIEFNGVEFKLAPAGTGKPNAVAGQGTDHRNCPAGQFNRVYVLAASSEGDQKATFKVGDQAGRFDHRKLGRIYRPVGHAHLGSHAHRDWASSANHAVWPLPAPAANAEPRTAPSRAIPTIFVGMTPGYIKPPTWPGIARTTTPPMD